MSGSPIRYKDGGPVFPPNSTLPYPEYRGFQATVTRNNQLIFYGGVIEHFNKSKSIFSDLWVLNIDQLIFGQVTSGNLFFYIGIFFWCFKKGPIGITGISGDVTTNNEDSNSSIAIIIGVIVPIVVIVIGVFIFFLIRKKRVAR